MIESIIRGEVLIDRAVFMADTASRFMAAQPKLSAEDAFARAESLWDVMTSKFVQSESTTDSSSDGARNVIPMRIG